MNYKDMSYEDTSRAPMEKDQMETQRQNIQQLFLQSCNLSKNCISMLDEKMHARVDVNDAKVHFDLLSYLYIWHLTLLGPFFCTKNEKNDFEEKKFNERFGECSIFSTSKDPIGNNIECCTYSF